MPQKTRKEKMLAQKHRQLQYVIKEQPMVMPEKIEHKESIALPSETKEDAVTKKYFFIDLKRSLIFIVGIFALEFFLYFARIGNYFR